MRHRGQPLCQCQQAVRHGLPLGGQALDDANTVYALDSSTIDLCLSLFSWAPFRSTKAAIKLHTLLDLRGAIPAFIHISDGKLHDVNVLDMLVFEAGAFYVMNRGYVDFERLQRYAAPLQSSELSRFGGRALRKEGGYIYSSRDGHPSLPEGCAHGFGGRRRGGLEGHRARGGERWPDYRASELACRVLASVKGSPLRLPLRQLE